MSTDLCMVRLNGFGCNQYFLCQHISTCMHIALYNCNAMFNDVYKCYNQIDASCVGRIPESVMIAESTTKGISVPSGWSCSLPPAVDSTCANFSLIMSKGSNESTALITVNLSELLQLNAQYKIWVVLGNRAGEVTASNYILFSKLTCSLFNATFTITMLVSFVIMNTFLMMHKSRHI